MRKKLTSRKFWISVATAAYFGGMAIYERGTQLSSIIYALCMVGVVVAWIIIEGFCDSDSIVMDEGDLIEETQEDEADE